MLFASRGLRRVRSYFSVDGETFRGAGGRRPANAAAPLFEFLEHRRLLSASLTLSGNGATIANGESAPTAAIATNFGSASTTVNGALGFVTRTYTITNTTGAIIFLTGGANLVQITGPNAADFSVVAAPSASIAAGGTTTFTVQFIPQAAGTRDANISIFNSSGDEGDFSFAVTGGGLLTTNAADNLQVATKVAGSGNIAAINGDVLEVTYTGSLLNGTVFDSTAIEGGTPLTFRLDDTSGFSYLVNDKTGNSSVDQQLIGGWEEGLQGTKVGETRTLIIPSSLAYGATGQGSVPANATLIFDITIDQIGYSPELGITGNSITIVPGTATTNTADGTDFGALAAGTPSASHTFSLLDLSEATNISGTLVDGLSVTGATITGPNAGDFSIPGSSGSTFSVVFKPTTAGIRTATINIFSNDPDHPDYSFAVSGSAAGAGSADITGSLVSTTIPASVIAGQALKGNFAVNIINDGQAILPKGQQATIAVIAHNTATGANTTIYTSPAESISQLKIGTGKKFTLNVKDAAGLAAGAYQYYAQLTPVQALAESNTSNNLVTTTAAGAALTIQAAAAFNDLTGALVSSSLVSSATGVKGKVVVSVKNAGNVVLPAGQQIQLQIIAKGVVTSAGDPGQFTLQISTFSVKNWKAGQVGKFTVTVKDPTPLGGAMYGVEANIVTVPALVESNSANNLVTMTAGGQLLDFVSTNAPNFLARAVGYHR